MAILNTEGISQYYELLGDPTKPTVMMISGLGGVGASWGSADQAVRRTLSRHPS